MKNQIRLGILQVGQVYPSLGHQFESYKMMYHNLLSKELAKSNIELVSTAYNIKEFKQPQSIFDNDIYMITGSKYGVYENYPWIHFLTDLVEKIIANKIKLVGICFGHQIIAKVLSAEVIKGEQGWKIGLINYQLQKKPSWIDSEFNSINLLSIHQDQVVSVPKEADLWLTSSVCPVAGFFVADSIFTIQSHPEFSSHYLRALLNQLKFRYSDSQFNRAIKSLEGQVDNQLFQSWLKKFVEI